MNLEDKIGQLLVVGFDGYEAPDYILDWLAEGRIGGVILFGRNVKNPSQLAALTQSLHQAAKYPLLISIDQEGGTVARLRQGFTESPGAMALAVGGSEERAEAVAAVLAEEMRAMGINWDYAPVVDLTHDTSNPSVGTRSLGTDPLQVGKLAAAQVRGYQKMGVAACAKHFPGLGNTPTDTHVALAVISGSADYLYEHDLIPFRATVDAGIDSVMICHVKFEALDPDYPSTLSPRVISHMLREEIGFTGLATTDCMEMKAVANHYGAGESAVLAALAGVDMILFSHTRTMQEEAYTALLEAANSGRLPMSRINEALSRIQTFKQQYAITDHPNPDLIRRPENLAVMEKAARAGVVLFQGSLTPLELSQNIALVEFASPLDSEAMGSESKTNLGGLLRQQLPQVQHVALYPPEYAGAEQAEEAVKNADLLILASRSAHLNPSQRDTANRLLQQAKQSILLCLRNPYDVVALHGADVVVCTCGDSTPSLQAAIDALLGKFVPEGRLPVEVQA